MRSFWLSIYIGFGLECLTGNLCFGTHLHETCPTQPGIISRADFIDGEETIQGLTPSRTLQKLYPKNTNQLESNIAPWLVSLEDLNYVDPIHFCWGTIISSTWVLTSAFCIQGTRPDDIQITAGLLHQDRTLRQSSIAKTLIIHKFYDQFTRENDVALITLHQGFYLNDHISTAKIVENCQYPHMCGFSGWNRDQATREISARIQSEHFDILTNEYCNEIYQGVVSDNMFCIQFREYEIAGNWGAPFSCDGNIVIGISSWKNGNWDFPTVFVNITEYSPWIFSVAYDLRNLE